MYTVSLKKEMIARHFMPQARDRERSIHSHPYIVELTLEGETLDDSGYLVDLDEMDNALTTTVETLRDRVLNDLPAFDHTVPSLENLCRVVFESVVPWLPGERLSLARVTIWENPVARASYEKRMH